MMDLNFMPRRLIAAILVSVIGIAVLGVAVVLVQRVRSRHEIGPGAQVNTLAAALVQYSFGGCPPTMACSIVPRIAARVLFEVTSSNTVITERDSIIVTAKVRYEVDSPFKPANDKGEDPILAKFAVQLSGAGLLVEPSGPVKLTTNGVAHWSIKPTSIGAFTLVLTPTLPSDTDILERFGPAVEREYKREKTPNDLLSRLPQQEHHPKPWISLIEADPVRVTVKPSSYRIAEFVVPAFTGFMGSLLTLPGLIAFRESRRRQQRGDSRIVVTADIPKER
jgi:hypothetical protein